MIGQNCLVNRDLLYRKNYTVEKFLQNCSTDIEKILKHDVIFGGMLVGGERFLYWKCKGSQALKALPEVEVSRNREIE